MSLTWENTKHVVLPGRVTVNLTGVVEPVYWSGSDRRVRSAPVVGVKRSFHFGRDFDLKLLEFTCLSMQDELRSISRNVILFSVDNEPEQIESQPDRTLEAVMTRGVSEKGYKLTQNRKNILNLLIEEGGAIKSKEGRATALMHGLLEHGGSLVSLNATLRELESLGFIERQVEGRRTYGISITDKAREELKGELVEAKPVRPPVGVETNGATAQQAVEAAAPVEIPATSSPASDFDWDDNSDPAAVPDGIDYDVLLGVFLKAALRGMEGPSNGELEYYQQQNEAAMARIQYLEAEVDKLRGEAASAISERDQLQKNLNVLMSRSEQKRGRGSNPIRNLLKPDELAALDTLMRQIPTRQGE